MQFSTSFDEYARTKTSRAINAILRHIGSVYSEELLSALSSGDFNKVIDVRIPDPLQYEDASTFAKDYLAYSLVRKLDCLPTETDKAGNALAEFLKSEKSCAKINRFHGRDPDVTYDGPLDHSFEAILHVAKGKIRDVLGTFSWDEAFKHFSFSGGASTRLRKKAGAPFYKYQGIPEVTRNCALLSVCAIWSTPLWKNQMHEINSDPTTWVKVVEGSVYTTVPKTSFTDRSICKEADMDMYVQKGLGAVIRNRLRRVGVDLNDQTLNQRLALIGSSTGSLVTIDLSAASDSVSLSVVRALLPADWFDALIRARAEFTKLPCGTLHRLEKISSMGNGYTFELESLIFWALSSAVLAVYNVEDKRLGIYGDDIVVHNSCAMPLIEVLKYLGFNTNKNKTFVSGPFRESCGKHYFFGQDVSPFYIKSAVETVDRAYWLLNSLRQWITRCDPEAESWRKTLRYLWKLLLPNHRDRIAIPPHLGPNQGLYVASLQYSGALYSLRKQGYLYKCVRPVRRRFVPNGTPAVLHWFNGKRDAVSSLGSTPLAIEKGDTRYRRFSASTSSWDDILIVFGDVSAP